MNEIAIIVPVYNAGAWVERCLGSLSGQTFGDWRALVVDDCSTDDTAERVERYARKEPRVTLMRKAHGGVAAARNCGLDALTELKPRFVTFVDADDYLEADALASMRNVALETGAEIVHCKFFSDYASGYEYEARNLFPAGSVFPASKFSSTVYWKMILGIQMNHVCTKLYRARLFEGMRFDETMRTGEDLLMNMRLFPKASSYAYLARPLYHYIRDTQGGLTNASLSWGKKFQCNWRVSRHMLELLPEWGMRSPLVRVCVVARPLVLLFSKSYRAVRSKLGARRKRRSAAASAKYDEI